MDNVKILEVKQSIFASNDEQAAQLRQSLKEKKIFLLNLMSAPGSGKTTTLRSTIAVLKDELRIGVMEADIDSDVDAKAIAAAGAKAIQLHTGGMCHLDAGMTQQGLRELGTDDLDLVVLENVGNLVCPAEFDTGAVKNAMILSVPEGHDKPLKYPLIFTVCDALIINKIDVLPYFDFDLDAVVERAKKINPSIQVLPICAKLEQDIAERDDLTQPEKLVMSSERFVKHFEDRGFTNIVLSAKAHSVQTTLDTYRALSREIPHVPLHLGVTEAGTKLQGTIKSSVGLGILLSEGIGDTMRVSLTADPVEEPPVAWGILQSLGLRRRGPEIVSCPTCARCQVNLIPIAEEVTERLKNYSAPLSIAVMGCAVNGPGEASDADLGVACGRGQALLFSHGQIIGKVAEDQIVDALMAEVDKLIEEK